MKKIFLALLLIVPAFVLVQGVGLGSAQTASQVQYPIEILDYCDSLAICQDVCADAMKYSLCYELELEYGVEFLMTPARDIVLSVMDGSIYPIEFLGQCDSYNDCYTYCQDTTNHLDCYEIEQTYGLFLLTQKQRDVVLQSMNTSTTTEQSIYPITPLGNCDSLEECQVFCEAPEQALNCEDIEFVYGIQLLPLASTITVEQPPGAEEEESAEEETEQEQTAQSTTAMSQIEYPVEELGYCDSAQDCQVYCDDIANYDACLAYGVANRLYPPARELMAQAVLDGEGPNECFGRECSQACENVTERMMCVEFAVEHGDIEEEERAAVEALLEEQGPGGCVTEEECDIYCADEANVKECIDFAVEHGLMDETERERVVAVRSDGPGGCRGEIECEAYCAVESNIDECMRFAIEHGLMTPEQEAYVLDLHLGLLDGPGGCRGEIECEVYCAVATHEQECLQFALDNRLGAAVEAMSSESAQTQDTRRADTQSSDYIILIDDETGAEIHVRLEDLIEDADREFIHPEGCDTINECRDFCDLPENKDECLPFAG